MRTSEAVVRVVRSENRGVAVDVRVAPEFGDMRIAVVRAGGRLRW